MEAKVIEAKQKVNAGNGDSDVTSLVCLSEEKCSYELWSLLVEKETLSAPEQSSEAISIRLMLPSAHM